MVTSPGKEQILNMPIPTDAFMQKVLEICQADAS